MMFSLLLSALELAIFLNRPRASSIQAPFGFKAAKEVIRVGVHYSRLHHSKFARSDLFCSSDVFRYIRPSPQAILI